MALSSSLEERILPLPIMVDYHTGMRRSLWSFVTLTIGTMLAWGLSIRQLLNKHMMPSPILFLLAMNYWMFNLQLKAVLKSRMMATRSLRVGIMNALIECKWYLGWRTIGITLWVRRSVFFSSSLMRPVNVGSNHRPSLSIPMTGSNITWQNDSFRGILPNRNGELHRHYGYVKRTQVIDEAGTRRNALRRQVPS